MTRLPAFGASHMPSCRRRFLCAGLFGGFDRQDAALIASAIFRIVSTSVSSTVLLSETAANAVSSALRTASAFFCDSSVSDGFTFFKPLRNSISRDRTCRRGNVSVAGVPSGLKPPVNDPPTNPPPVANFS